MTVVDVVHPRDADRTWASGAFLALLELPLAILIKNGAASRHRVRHSPRRALALGGPALRVPADPRPHGPRRVRPDSTERPPLRFAWKWQAVVPEQSLWT